MNCLAFSLFDYLHDKFGVGTSPFTNLVAIIAVIVFALWVLGMGFRIIFAIGGFLLVVLIPTCTISALKQCQDSRDEEMSIEEIVHNSYE